MKTRRLRFPISLQIFTLTVATVLIAQAVTVTAVVLMPPSRPPLYEITDIVGAVRDGDRSEGRRPLRRTYAARLPTEFADPTGSEADRAAGLAAALGLAPDRVRFSHRDVPRAVLMTTGGGPGGIGSPPAGRLPPSGEEFGSKGRAPPPPGRAPDPSPGAAGGPGRGMRISEFAAAIRQADGRWLIIQPSPETEWLPRILFWIFGSLLVVGPLAWWFANRISRPMRDFASAAERLGQNPAEEPVTIAGPAEIGVAAEAFNQMQARLNRYIRDRIGMVGAISHDLRAPLSRMRFKVEAAPEPLRRLILDDIEHMDAIIASVLGFVRDVDHVAPRLRLDLTSLISCAVDDLAETGAMVRVTGEPQVHIITGDPVGLRRVVDNLLDNAIKYGGEAIVSIERVMDDVIVRIDDRGPGMEPSELERVFEPFYRIDDGRHDRGAGLGLAIARSTARSHGGDVTLRATHDGLSAIVILPLSS